MTTTQKIEASRETRLWIGTIIVPLVGYLMVDPETRENVKKAIRGTAESAKDKVRQIAGKLRKES